MEKKNKFIKSKLGKILVISGLSIFVLALAIGGYFVYKANVTWNDIYEERERDEDPIADLIDNKGKKEQPKPTENKPNEKVRKAFTIALLGVDTRQNNSFKGRTDANIIAIVNPETKKVTLLSIPRDSYVYIPVKDMYDKIGHAHAYGRAQGSIDTFENLLEIPIDYYISINFHAFRDLINELGGITIDVEKDMGSLKKGVQLLDGNEALGYVRFRKDREGDFGRNRRQQQMIKEIINQTLEVRNPVKISSMLDILGANIKTDIALDNLIYLAKQFESIKGDDMDSILLTGNPFYKDGISYVGIDSTELILLREKLQLLLFETNE